MNIPRSRLGLPGEDIVDVLNVKLDDPLLRDLLVQQDGYFPGYHISRGNWVSILLDGSVLIEDASKSTTAIVPRRRSRRRKQSVPRRNG